MFVIEDYIKVLKDFRFVRVEGLEFSTSDEAHTELRRLKELGEISKKAVVTLYPEE